MADKPPRSRALAPVQPRDVVIHPEDDPPFDHNGFDPNDFEWRPVPRRPRADGWTPEVQRRFIETLAQTGMVTAACEAVDMSVQSAYRLRTAPGSAGFARAWEVALDMASDALIDTVFSRVFEGVEEPVFDRDGCRVGARTRYSDRLAMFLLRAYRPERFRHAHESVRQPGEALPARTPLAQAIEALSPVTPADPHLLLAPDRLEDLVGDALDQVLIDEIKPPDDREHYVRRRVEPDHPRARERRLERHRREVEREGRRASARATAGDPHGGDDDAED